MDNQLTVRALTRDRVVFEGKAKALTSYNEKGVFDVLFGHENFISIVYKSLFIHLDSTHTQEIKIDHGILKVHDNNVEIYLIRPVKEKI